MGLLICIKKVKEGLLIGSWPVRGGASGRWSTPLIVNQGDSRDS